MTNRTITSKPTEKIPSYVPIYNMLYSDIVSGFYQDGTQLPSETVLTEKYGVSRNTLRQALTILNEDGLIQKRQGKGTVVIYKGDAKTLLEQHIGNLVIQCAKDEIDAIDTDYNYGPPTEVAQRKLGIKATEIVLASNNVYFSGGKPVGHAFIQIPVKHINEIDVEIHSEDEVSNMINKTIFELADSARLNVKLVYAEENITSFLRIQTGEPVIFIEEILFNVQGEGLARCKFYFLPDKYEISINI